MYVLKSDTKTWKNPKDGSLWNKTFYSPTNSRDPYDVFRVSLKKNKLQQSDEWISDFQSKMTLIDFFGDIKTEVDDVKRQLNDKKQVVTKHSHISKTFEDSPTQRSKKTFATIREYFLEDNELYIRSNFLYSLQGDEQKIGCIIFKENDAHLLSNFFLSIPAKKGGQKMFNVMIPFMEDKKQITDPEIEKKLIAESPTYINRHLSYQGFLFIHERVEEIADEYFHMECIGTMRPEE